MYSNIEQLSREAAWHVINGMSRENAVKHVLNLECQRNDPTNQIQTGDSSDIIIYIDSSLNEPNIPDTPQIRLIAKELEKYFEYDLK